jgi:hypothetical protein
MKRKSGLCVDASIAERHYRGCGMTGDERKTNSGTWDQGQSKQIGHNVVPTLPSLERS